MNVSPISKAVRTRRVEAGLSQQSLATRAGLSLRTLSRIEAGEDCTVSTLASLADALGITTADLLGTEVVEATA